MQFKVPQNIDKEDQIVGPLTLIQFSYLAIGGALDILINQTFSGAGKFPLILLISFIALALAFLKIQDRPILFFVTATISFIMQPKVRVWHKTSDRPILQMRKSTPKKESLVLQKSYDQAKIDRISHVLDTRGRGGETKPASPFANVDTGKLQ